MIETTYNVGIYCRLSNDDERDGESVSIENQKLLLQNFCHGRLSGTGTAKNTDHFPFCSDFFPQKVIQRSRLLHFFERELICFIFDCRHWK